MTQIPKVQYRAKDEKVGFEMFPLENLVSLNIPTDHNPFQPHRLNFFAILLLTAGNVEHTLDFKKHSLAQNDCLVISKNQVHSFDNVHKYKGFLILFTEDFITKNLAKSTVDSISRIYNYHIFSSKYKIDADSFDIFKLLQKEYQLQNNAIKPNIIASLFSAFLLKMEMYNQTEPFKATFNHQYDLFTAFETNVENHFAENRNAKFYAEKQNITYKHLNEVCKQFSNKTAKEFIDDFIILEAKRQLTSTTQSVKEIAYNCGFDEVTNFQKYFKNISNETPVSFRQKFQ